MKRKLLFIIPGVLILLLVFGVWIYLMLYGVPQDRGDVFANLTGDETGGEFSEEPVTAPAPIVTTPSAPAAEALRQLTIRPVAGAALVTTETGQTKVRYAERGTGHIYEMNLSGDGEIRLSGTTVPRVTSAQFAPSGEYLALVKEETAAAETTIGFITTTEAGDPSLEQFTLPSDARNVAFSEDEQIVRFTISSQQGTRGYQEDLASGAREQVFNIPLRDVLVEWENEQDWYIRTKPAASQAGFAYQLIDNNLTPLTPSARGLMTIPTDTFVLRSYQEDSQIFMDAIDRSTGVAIMLPLTMLPEKCAFNPQNSNRAWCAAPESIRTGSVYPDDWYKGLISYSDSLWEINLPAQEATLQSDFTAVSGRQIDATKVSTNGLHVIFINRLDDTLWIFDTTI